MKYINTYNTTADYNNDSARLYPNVSYIKDVKEVKWARTDPTLIVAKFTSSSNAIVAYKQELFSSITIDGEEQTIDTGIMRYLFNGGEHEVVYRLVDPTTLGQQALFSCQGITSIKIPETVTTIGALAMSSCTGLTSLTIPDSVTTIGDQAFQGCSGLTSIIIPNSVTSINYGAFQNCTGLTSVTIPDSVTTINNYAFNGCKGLTSVVMGNAVTTIRQNAFADCKHLTNITIPSSVTILENSAFSGCNSLTSVVIDSNSVVAANYRSYNSLYNVFGGQVTSIVIPDSATTIGEWAFRAFKNLTSFTIPASVTSIGQGALNSSGLTSINIPASLTSIGNNAFQNCSNVVSVTVDSGNTAYNDGNGSNCIIRTSTNALIQGCNNTVIPNTVVTIGAAAFAGCTGLASVTIPDSVTTIGTQAFAGCTGLTSLTIPNSVTIIGQYAFQACSGLTNANIGSGVTDILNLSFSDCTGLTSFTCNATTPPRLVPNVFQNVPATCAIYVPAASVDAYKAATNWSSRADYIQAIQ